MSARRNRIITGIVLSPRLNTLHGLQSDLIGSKNLLPIPHIYPISKTF